MHKGKSLEEKIEELTPKDIEYWGDIPDWELIKYINNGAYGYIFLAESRVVKEQKRVIKIYDLSKGAIKDLQTHYGLKDPNNDEEISEKLLEALSHEAMENLGSQLNHEESKYISLPDSFTKQITSIKGKKKLASINKVLEIDLQKKIDLKGYENLESKLKLSKEIAQCFSIPHKKGYVHNDIKASNLGFDRNGQLKVFDFGIATTMTSNFYDDYKNIGSMAMRDPELKPIGAKPSTRSDVWQIGCLFNYIFTKENPFDFKDRPAKTDPQRLEWEENKYPKLVQEHLPEVFENLNKNIIPNRIQKMIKKCLSPVSSNRYGDASEIFTEFDYFYKQDIQEVKVYDSFLKLFSDKLENNSDLLLKLLPPYIKEPEMIEHLLTHINKDKKEESTEKILSIYTNLNDSFDTLEDLTRYICRYKSDLIKLKQSLSSDPADESSISIDLKKHMNINTNNQDIESKSLILDENKVKTYKQMVVLLQGKIEENNYIYFNVPIDKLKKIYFPKESLKHFKLIKNENKIPFDDFLEIDRIKEENKLKIFAKNNYFQKNINARLSESTNKEKVGFAIHKDNFDYNTLKEFLNNNHKIMIPNIQIPFEIKGVFNSNDLQKIILENEIKDEMVNSYIGINFEYVPEFTPAKFIDNLFFKTNKKFMKFNTVIKTNEGIETLHINTGNTIYAIREDGEGIEKLSQLSRYFKDIKEFNECKVESSQEKLSEVNYSDYKGGTLAVAYPLKESGLRGTGFATSLFKIIDNIKKNYKVEIVGCINPNEIYSLDSLMGIMAGFLPAAYDDEKMYFITKGENQKQAINNLVESINSLEV